MSKSADRRYVEDWVGVLAVVHASLREDDGDEVDARIAK